MKQSLTLILFFAMLPSAMAAEKPNIIIFLADDLGYADIGVYGCRDIPTPHVDAIANNGVKFTDGYANHPVCSPSRAGLISGMYQHRFGFEHNSGPENYASPDFGMPRTIPSLAEKLKAGGYATGMVGKWHIGFQEGLRPHDRGFDFFYGFLPGARTYYPVGPKQNNTLFRYDNEVKDEKEYLTDAFARESVEFIESNKDQPWFLYVAFNAVHSPLEATEKYEARFPDITNAKRKTYAGMLAALDDAVGRVMAKVRELGLEENTLVLFYSDNGGPTQETTSRNDPLRGVKGQMFEGGIRVPFAMQWKGVVPAGRTYREMVMGFDYHTTALAAAGVEVSSDQPIDGVDLIPFVTGQAKGQPHEQLFWRAGRSHAARVDNWKLVTDPRRGGTMLFNLKNDLGEQEDRARSNPTKLKELQAAYDTWSKQVMRPKWIRQDRRNARPGGKLISETSSRNKTAALLQQLFRQADRNRDGKLSVKEYPQPGVFKDVDANSDGFATREEIRAYYNAHRDKRSAVRQETPTELATRTGLSRRFATAPPLPPHIEEIVGQRTGEPPLKKMPESDAARYAAGRGQTERCQQESLVTTPVHRGI